MTATEVDQQQRLRSSEIPDSNEPKSSLSSHADGGYQSWTLMKVSAAAASDGSYLANLRPPQLANPHLQRTRNTH